MRKLCLLLLGSTLFFSCSQPAGTTDPAGAFSLDSAKAAIDANNAVLIKALKAGDSAAFVSCYTKDGCTMGSNMPKLCGPAGLGQFLAGARQMGIENLKLTTTEVIGNKDLISEEGTYEILGNDGASLDKGKFIVTWKQEDGKWKKYRDIFNSDMPPPPPAKK
jgi:ketosteroid isomerase-like protein